MRSSKFGSVSGSGASGIGIWCSGPGSSGWNDAERWKIACAVLDGDTRRVVNVRAVADAVDLVEDRESSGRRGGGSRRAASATRAALDRAARGDERLPGDLAAEDALAALLRAPAAEEVHLELLEVEDSMSCSSARDMRPSNGQRPASASRSSRSGMRSWPQNGSPRKTKSGTPKTWSSRAPPPWHASNARAPSPAR